MKGAGSVRRVAKLRRCFQLVRDIDQILTERPQDIRADVAAQDHLAGPCHGVDQVRDREVTSSSRRRSRSSASTRILGRRSAAAW
jgi:hypothetical protein